jgi:hypothetical protein
MYSDNFPLVLFTFFGGMYLLVLLLNLFFVWLGHRQPKLPEERIVKYWRDDLAKYYYRLERVNGYNTGYYDTEESGNFKWAQRQQKHYNCKIIKDDYIINE